MPPKIKKVSDPKSYAWTRNHRLKDDEFELRWAQFCSSSEHSVAQTQFRNNKNNVQFQRRWEHWLENKLASIESEAKRARKAMLSSTPSKPPDVISPWGHTGNSSVQQHQQTPQVQKQWGAAQPTQTPWEYREQMAKLQELRRRKEEDETERKRLEEEERKQLEDKQRIEHERKRLENQQRMEEEKQRKIREEQYLLQKQQQEIMRNQQEEAEFQQKELPPLAGTGGSSSSGGGAKKVNGGVWDDYGLDGVETERKQ